MFGGLLMLGSAEAGELSLARPFGSHMVLPMERPLPVWGQGEAGKEVTVAFGGRTASATVDAGGNWRVQLPALGASSRGRELAVRCGKESIRLDDVLVGRVWLCSGQSNMDFPLGRAVGGKEEAAAAASFPGIRLCNLTGVPTDARRYDEATFARLNERDHFQGSWQCAGQAGAAAFSAVAWWAGKTIHEASGVPVGLVENAVGGSGAEAWLPRDLLQSEEHYRSLAGGGWLDCGQIGAWARGRARQNLGDRLEGEHPFKPGFLFESGVRAWAGFPFDGVLWYQGETNAEIHDDAWNERLIRDLVTGWRAGLQQKDLPFFMVGLPRIGGTDPLRRWWPEFRAVQARVAADVPGVTLVPTVDLGWDSPDVHPPDKRPVGVRLGEKVVGLQNQSGK